MDKIKKAIGIIYSYGAIDGEHHKTWVIDQVLRALTGCPDIKEESVDSNGKPYTYVSQGKNKKYIELTSFHDESGDMVDVWDEGIAP